MHERVGCCRLRATVACLRRVSDISIVVLAPTVATMTTSPEHRDGLGNEDDPGLATTLIGSDAR